MTVVEQKENNSNYFSELLSFRAGHCFKNNASLKE